MCYSSYGGLLPSFIQMCESIAKKRPKNLCDRQTEWQTKCKHIVPSGWSGWGLITTWSDVKKGPRKFPDRFQLREHMEIRHRESLICSHCSRKISSKSGLRFYQRAVRGEFKYRCSECGKTFIEKNHFDCHMNTHRDYKPYSCAHCKKPYGYRSKLSVPE